MGLLDFLLSDTFRFVQHLFESIRDSVGWAIQLVDTGASRLVRSTLQSIEHSLVPILSAALGQEVGMLRIVALEVFVTVVKVLALAALIYLVLRALPRQAAWCASIALCVGVLCAQPSDFASATAGPAPSGPTPSGPTPSGPTPHAPTPAPAATPRIICTPPLVNDTGRCDCPIGLVLDRSTNCVCPPRHTFDGSRCHECLRPRDVHNNECRCPHPMYWTGHTCACPGQLVEGGGGCVCPNNLVQHGADQCIPRMHAQTIKWLRVRAGGSLDSMRLCTAANGCVEAGGKRGAERVWQLEPNQCIVRVEWWWGDSVVGIRFTANDGTSLFHGNTDAAYHESHAPAGQCLTGAELGDHRPIKYWGTVRVLKHFRPTWG